VIRELATAANPVWPVRRKIEVTGAKITGQLDLTGAHLSVPLLLVKCYFEEPPVLIDVSAPEVSFKGSQVWNLDATGIIVHGDLILGRSSPELGK
jgi:hypothetical protein